MAKRTFKINRIARAFGIYDLFMCIYEFIKHVNYVTRTEIMSNEMYVKLQDRRNLEILHKEISYYKKTGKWRYFKLF